MADLYLTREDRYRLADLFSGRDCPPDVRRGTWHSILGVEIDSLGMDELAALARFEPEVIRALRLPEQLP